MCEHICECNVIHFAWPRLAHRHRHHHPSYVNKSCFSHFCLLYKRNSTAEWFYKFHRSFGRLNFHQMLGLQYVVTTKHWWLAASHTNRWLHTWSIRDSMRFEKKNNLHEFSMWIRSNCKLSNWSTGVQWEVGLDTETGRLVFRWKAYRVYTHIALPCTQTGRNARGPKHLMSMNRVNKA